MTGRKFIWNRFVRSMNPILEAYAENHDAAGTYEKLEELEPMIHTEGERALYQLNRASLLYDMKKFREAADLVVEIPSLNSEFDAQVAELKTRLMEAGYLY